MALLDSAVSLLTPDLFAKARAILPPITLPRPRRRLLGGLPDRPTALVWAPDGSHLAMICHPAETVVWHATRDACDYFPPAMAFAFTGGDAQTLLWDDGQHVQHSRMLLTVSIAEGASTSCKRWSRLLPMDADRCVFVEGFEPDRFPKSARWTARCLASGASWPFAGGPCSGPVEVLRDHNLLAVADAALLQFWEVPSRGVELPKTLLRQQVAMPCTDVIRALATYQHSCVVGCVRGHCYEYDCRAQAWTRGVECPGKDAITALAVSSDGRVLFVSTSNAASMIGMDWQRGEVLRNIGPFYRRRSPRLLAASPDCRVIACDEYLPPTDDRCWSDRVLDWSDRMGIRSGGQLRLVTLLDFGTPHFGVTHWADASFG